MTAVDVQWALHGKVGEGTGYRILARSTGDLSMANFTEIISRFQLGRPETFPQVSISYLRPANRQQPGYLALAIHRLADRGRPAADEDGRPIVYTNYFCLPYPPLAAAASTYLSMYEALRDLRLPTANGPAMRVTVARRALRPFVIDPLAMRVAALLLTGRCVCLLDAQAVPLAGRLDFIDRVMALLPYGFRARMTAATWTSPTYRDHQFRLFFSDAPRGAQGDHVVRWGRPETALITPADGGAQGYLTWLEATFSHPLACLEGLTEGMGFGGDPGETALELVTQVTPQADQAEEEGKSDQDDEDDEDDEDDAETED